jgi:hypothetical protein
MRDQRDPELLWARIEALRKSGYSLLAAADYACTNARDVPDCTR